MISVRAKALLLPLISYDGTFLFHLISFDTTPLPPFDKGDFSLLKKSLQEKFGYRKTGVFMEKELESDSLFQVLIKSFYLAFGFESPEQINTELKEILAASVR